MTTTAALVLALALGAASAGAAGRDQGNALITSVEASSGRILLDDEEYEVTDRTALEDEQGNELTIGELPSMERGAEADDAAVYFEAAEARGSGPRALLRLKLTGSVPK
jgi:hypothetical protein